MINPHTYFALFTFVVTVVFADYTVLNFNVYAKTQTEAEAVAADDTRHVETDAEISVIIVKLAPGQQLIEIHSMKE